MGFLMVDGDVSWFDGERDTWHMHRALGGMIYGLWRPNVLHQRLNVSPRGPTSPFRA
jgi:hypothetical protein